MAIVTGKDGRLKETSLTKREKEKLLSISRADRAERYPLGKLKNRKSGVPPSLAGYIAPSSFGIARATIEVRVKIRTDNPNLIKRVAEIQEELSFLASESMGQ